jgi:hypothetical protein
LKLLEIVINIQYKIYTGSVGVSIERKSLK